LCFDVVANERTRAIGLCQNHGWLARDINEDGEDEGTDGKPGQWVVNGT
jgi:hypothetical protein